MGNILPRKLSARDQLLKYEDEIRREETRLSGLQKGGFPFTFYSLSFLAVLLATLIAYMQESYPEVVSTLTLGILAILRFCIVCIRSLRLRTAERRLNSLREKHRGLVKEYKKDNNFAFAKKIIEQYDEEESRDSFFKQVQRKKKDAVEKISDYVLANDPSKMNALICHKCGLHNGLVDPASDSVKFFYCYSCKERNDRHIV